MSESVKSLKKVKHFGFLKMFAIHQCVFLRCLLCSIILDIFCHIFDVSSLYLQSRKQPNTNIATVDWRPLQFHPKSVCTTTHVMCLCIHKHIFQSDFKQYHAVLIKRSGSQTFSVTPLEEDITLPHPDKLVTK